jgi:predicted NAD/FAD-binding protein
VSERAEATRPRVAVIGAGVSGLTAAYLLTRRYEVTLFDADPRLGGHAHTHEVTDSVGNTLAVDSGFIVHNDSTYPLLRRLFGELGVTTRRTEMSMSIRDDATGWEYAGGRGVRGIFAQPRRMVDLRFLSVLAQVKRFHRQAAALLRETEDGDQTTFGTFLESRGFSRSFIDRYAVPLVSCVWSMGSDAALQYPARYLFEFLDHHGMLRVTGSPQWYTVVGGARTYVDAIVRRLPDVRPGCAVQAVLRDPEGVEIEDSSGRWTRHDKVVIATHADQALDVLADASPDEKAVLGAFRYTRNEAVLHTDARQLPQARQARASWNHLVATDAGGPPVVTYWMNRLQGLDSPDQFLVTLNPGDRVAPDTIIATMTYAHPIHDLAAQQAQRRLAALATPMTVFAGAYHGWGFHEDGCRSGVLAARAFGVDW